MAEFTKNEMQFLKNQEICRLATSSKNVPHVVPVCYILSNNFFYIATDYGTKKYKNILENKKVALVIDTYFPRHAVLIEGKAEILERGEEYRKVYGLFYKKFSWVRKDPWKEGEAPILKINVLKKISWNLD
ncbi:MAG: pyridoxamine 5'-phosphate oxidase family protein [Euryarchaeota archaeon]|nr:pyridoxamine 5'-phosphate oxidase family protein [Euryarchaeota archaeon]